MKRLWIVVPDLTGGGAQRVMVTLSRFLDREQFKISLVVGSLKGAVYLKDVPTDVELVDLRCERVRFLIFRMLPLILKKKPDIVFSTLWYLNIYLSIFRPLFPRGTRLVVRETIIVSRLLEGLRWSALLALLTRFFYRRVDRLVAQSDDMRQDLIHQFRIPENKIALIHNPVDLARIEAACLGCQVAIKQDFGSTRLIAVGRLVHQKGFDLLIEAVASLNDPSVYVDILGSGSLSGELKELVNKRGLVHQIRFLGFCHNPYPEMLRADAFILSSRFEGLPNVVLEALACGLPVIATPAPGGILELVGDLPECCVAATVSAEGLADAISSWQGGPRRRVSSEAVAAYSPENIARLYDDVLGQV